MTPLQAAHAAIETHGLTAATTQAWDAAIDAAFTTPEPDAAPNPATDADRDEENDR